MESFSARHQQAKATKGGRAQGLEQIPRRRRSSDTSLSRQTKRRKVSAAGMQAHDGNKAQLPESAIWDIVGAIGVDGFLAKFSSEVRSFEDSSFHSGPSTSATSTNAPNHFMMPVADEPQPFTLKTQAPALISNSARPWVLEQDPVQSSQQRGYLLRDGEDLAHCLARQISAAGAPHLNTRVPGPTFFESYFNGRKTNVQAPVAPHQRASISSQPSTTRQLRGHQAPQALHPDDKEFLEDAFGLPPDASDPVDGSISGDFWTEQDLLSIWSASQALDTSMMPTSTMSTFGTHTPTAPTATAPISTPAGKGRISGFDGRIAVAGNGYGDDLDGRPPVTVLLPNGIKIGAIEILTFFPRWLHHPDIVLRLVKAGWTRTDIAKAQLHAVNLLDIPTMKRVSERTQKQISVGGKLKMRLGGDRWSNNAHLHSIPYYDDLTLNAVSTRHDLDSTLPAMNPVDYKLADIAASVMQGGNWPSAAGDPDRLQMTQVLEYAFRNPALDLKISDSTRIIQQEGFADPGTLDSNHDLQALQRFSAAVPTPPETAKAKQAKRATKAKYRANGKARASR